VNIHVGLAVKVLDFVDSWLQFSVFEDGRGVASRWSDHGRVSAATWRTRASRGVIIYLVVSCTDACLPHFRHAGVRCRYPNDHRKGIDVRNYEPLSSLASCPSRFSVSDALPGGVNRYKAQEGVIIR
jgi:hypothetical protein